MRANERDELNTGMTHLQDEINKSHLEALKITEAQESINAKLTALVERTQQLEQITRRLHASLDDVIAFFVEPRARKYGQYSTLDEAFDALAESQDALHLPLTAGITQIIEEKRKETE